MYSTIYHINAYHATKPLAYWHSWQNYATITRIMIQYDHIETTPQTLLGFDFGTKRIGVAVGQTLTKQAKALVTIPVKNNVPTWDAINSLVEEWSPQALVVGIPLNMDGTEQPMSARARHFAKALHEQTSLPVHEAEERLSTVEAKTQQIESGHKIDASTLDAYAAEIILQAFLQSYSKGHPQQ